MWIPLGISVEKLAVEIAGLDVGLGLIVGVLADKIRLRVT